MKQLVPPRRARASAHAQRGVSTLVVVAALFLVVSLAAAYANRNLIFEQRASANQLRSTLAFETVEAGMEWAIAQLNTGLIDASCAPVDDDGSGTQTSFRQRYLQFADDGMLTPTTSPPTPTGPYPTCVAVAGNWQCGCPTAGAAVVAAPPAGVVAPAFRVRFVRRPPANRPGTVWLEVNACTSLDEACLAFPDPVNPAQPAPGGEARARAEVLLYLKSALPAPPVATLTARGQVTFSGGTFAVANARQGGAANLAVHAGGPIGNVPVLSGAPGEPVDPDRMRLPNDPALAFTALPAPDRADRFLASILGAQPEVFETQPAMLRPTCVGTTCTANELRAAWRRNPGRLLWVVDKDVELDANPLGTPEQPLLLFVQGDNISVNLDSSVVHGLIYGRTDQLTVSGNGGIVRGAVMVDGDFVGNSGTSGPSLIHDAEVLTRLQWRHGSFVRVPGSWRDF
jgi:hypothetical protein